MIAAINIEDVVRQQAGTLDGGRWLLERSVLRGVRKHRKKRFYEYDLVYVATDSRTEPLTLPVIVKDYGSDRGGIAHTVMSWLREHGFCPPASCLVPAALAYDPAVGLLVQERAVGDDVASTLYGHEVARSHAGARAGEWLARLHGQPTPDLLPTAPPYSIHVARFGDELEKRLPEHCARIDRLTSVVSGGVDRSEGRAFTHGDFHPKNVFVQGATVTAIDFDTAAFREPAADVGYFIAQASIMSYLRLGQFSEAVPLAYGLLREYAVAGSAVTWDRVRIHAARTFLQSLHFELCTLQTGRTSLAPAWLDLCEAWLQSEDESSLAALLGAGGGA